MARRRAKRVDRAEATPGLVLDAGALQALERRHVRLLVELRHAHALGLPVRIPAGSLAQSWRGGPRSASIARLLKQPCTVVQVDERSAREVGELIAALRLADDKPDVVDAHVALVARATRSLVWTSDPGDLERYGVDPAFIRRL
jgi:predicted nucleic acid-binding protein